MNAEQLQEHETRGYSLAKAWLALGVKEDDLRAAVCVLLYSRFQKPMPQSFFRWTLSATDHRQRAKALPNEWALMHVTMAGCELAIEEHEATHEG